MYQDSETTASDGTGDGLHQIASFHRVVKNYSKMKKIEAMTKGTPQPTDCRNCGKPKSQHHTVDVENNGMYAYLCDCAGNFEYAPIVPSPDSVKDMGEVFPAEQPETVATNTAEAAPDDEKKMVETFETYLSPLIRCGYLHAIIHLREWMANEPDIARCDWLEDQLCDMESNKHQVDKALLNKELEAYQNDRAATAARLEEVLAENQRLRETNNKLSDALESSGGFDVGFEYGADASGIKELRAEVERYREALRALTYDYRAHCNGVETPGLYRAESLLLSRGATEQSTEQ